MIHDNDYNNVAIASRVSIHDRHQFEVKLEYNLENPAGRNNYKTETFVFIPQSLQINQYHYLKEDFYNDLRNYIRFKTPTYNFDLVLNTDFKKSPFFILKRMINELKNPSDEGVHQKLLNSAFREIKLLGVMVRARMRDYSLCIRENIESRDYNLTDIIKNIRESAELATAVLVEFRELRRDFREELPREKELLRYFIIIEEFISHVLEDSLIGMMKTVKKEAGEHPDFKNLQDFLQDFFIKENGIRITEKYQIVFKKNEENKEQYLYYMGQYKKIIASVLYLDIEREKKKPAFIHLIGSGAAFAASILYLIITLYISQSFAIDSFLFVVLISLGYVFKDRIKDIIKIILNPKVLSMFPDHITQIADLSMESRPRFGEIREKVFYTTRDKLDEKVLHLRDKTRPLALLPYATTPEDILVYQKEINIDAEAIRENYSRTVDITDIMRFNIHRYLIKMDDPQQMINYFDIEKGAPVTTTGDRTYHINVVIKYTRFEGFNEQIRYERYRIVTDKFGIKRIKFIEVV